MKIGVAGCSGRMGITLVRLLSASNALTMASERKGAEAAAKAVLAAAGASGISVTDDPVVLFAACDAVIDFTAPGSTVALARAAASAGKIHIIGTTGLSAAEQKEIVAAAKSARIVQSGNYSLGVNVLEALVQKAAAMLADDYDIEIDEMHHALKKDAPSGTALMLAASAARGRGVSLDASKVHYGEGQLGERKRGTIGMSVKRGGEVVGVHTVTFAGPGENLELTHRGFSRDIYAHGAIKAAEWAKDQKPGLYSMRDVLGI